MFRHIVVPLDGSEFSRTALPWAIALGSGADTTLDIVSSIDARLLLSGAGYEGNLAAGAPVMAASAETPLTAPDLLAATRERREQHLRSTVEEVQAKADVTARWTLLEGEPTDAITAHVEESGADLVVMSTHGRGGIERAWLGSVADRVVRHVTRPVLLVRPREESRGGPALGTRPELRRVLVPLDGSGLAEAALGPASRIARGSGAELILARVIGRELTVGSPYLPHAAEDQAEHLEERRERARTYLEEVAERLRADGVPIAGAEVRSGTAAETLLELARERADMIAMATHGRGGLRRWVLGSVSDKVLRGGEQPVLLVRPEDDDRS